MHYIFFLSWQQKSINYGQITPLEAIWSWVIVVCIIENQILSPDEWAVNICHGWLEEG